MSGKHLIDLLRRYTYHSEQTLTIRLRFMFLHRNFNYASKPLSILLKVLVSQIIYTPLFNTYFFSLQSLLAGKPLSETVEVVQKAVPTSIVNSLKLWPAVTAFMFVYVDPQFRNIFAGGIAVWWQTYLSWLNQKAAREIRLAELAAGKDAEAVYMVGCRALAREKKTGAVISSLSLQAAARRKRYYDSGAGSSEDSLDSALIYLLLVCVGYDVPFPV